MTTDEEYLEQTILAIENGTATLEETRWFISIYKKLVEQHKITLADKIKKRKTIKILTTKCENCGREVKYMHGNWLAGWMQTCKYVNEFLKSEISW